ncbi:MAG: lipopolysaccharide transport periplasmic protein LptA [Campylobacteraceae bacterium]|nr:lipopolysaccharide transport periplasmic protein LptA [Campylobacteraceae bacterium]
MKKYITYIAILASCLFAAEVEITSNKFFADEKAQKAEFTGNVVIVKQKDILKADKVVIDFNSKNEPVKYTAIGNVDADLIMNEKRYKAKGKNFTYEPNKSTYSLWGNAFIHELDTDKKIYGEKIDIDQTTGIYRVNGRGNTPVKVIFKIEEK